MRVVFLLLLIVVVSLIASVRCDVITNTTVILPTRCYRSIEYESLNVIGDSSSLCENNICQVNWQTEIDWATQEVVSFQAIFENNRRCIEAYGTKIESIFSCKVTNFGDVQYNTMDVRLYISYENSDVSITWKYKGADVSCETLAQQPMLLDYRLVSRDVQISIGYPYNTAMKLVEGMPTPISAFNQDCPMATFDCQCNIGCTYAASAWASSSKLIDAVWNRVHPDGSELTICGVDKNDWLVESKKTQLYAVQIRKVLKEYCASTLNIDNFGCDEILQTQASTCYANITRDLVETKNPQAECNGLQDWAYCTYVLSTWNSGSYASETQLLTVLDQNTIIPCSCADDACAKHFVSVSSNDADPTINNIAPFFIDGTLIDTNTVDSNKSISTNNHHLPQHWDTWKLVFFILAIVFGAIMLVLIGLLICTVGRSMIGPTGLRSMASNINEMTPPVFNNQTAYTRVVDVGQ